MSSGVFGKVSQRSAAAPARVYSLHVGDTYLEPLDVVRTDAPSGASASSAARDFKPDLFKYAPTTGEPELIRAVVDKVRRRSHVTLDPACVQIMAGATAAMGIVCGALLDAGDEVLVPAPFWPLIRGAVRARGATAIELPFFTRLGEPGFDPIAELERAITPRTVANYVNTPHNPTGRILSDQVLAGIAELARKHSLWVIADEAYEDVWFGSEAPRSFFAQSGVAPFTITTHSVSKAYALAGARIGYTHAAPEVMDIIRGVQTFYSYCATRPMQFSAARALDAGDAWLVNMRATYAQAARAAASALEVPTPEGGTFLFFDVTRFMGRSETLTDVLERCLDAGVMLTPGTSCGNDFGGWARLCFTTLPPNELQEALERLRGALFR